MKLKPDLGTFRPSSQEADPADPTAPMAAQLTLYASSSQPPILHVPAMSLSMHQSQPTMPAT